MDDDPSSETPELDLDKDGQHLVTLRGPPGSEPRQALPMTGGVSETRFEKDNSLVYHRNSMKATLSSYISPSKLSQIKLKDSQRETVEVFVTLPNEGSRQRCTRARESVFLNNCHPTNGLNYSELSTDSESDSEEEQYRVQSPSYLATGTNAKSKSNKHNSLKSTPSTSVGPILSVINPAQSELSSSSINCTLPTNHSPAKKQTARMVAIVNPRFDDGSRSTIEYDATSPNSQLSEATPTSTPTDSYATPSTSSSLSSNATPTTPPPSDIDTQGSEPRSKESIEVAFDKQNLSSSSEHMIVVEATEHEVFTETKITGRIAASPKVDVFMDTEIEVGETVQDDQLKITNPREIILESLSRQSSLDEQLQVERADGTRKDLSSKEDGQLGKRTSSDSGSGIFTVYNDLKASQNSSYNDKSVSGKAVRRSGRLARNRPNSTSSGVIHVPVKIEVVTPLKRNPLLRLRKLSFETLKALTPKEHKVKIESNGDAKQLHRFDAPLLPSSSLNDNEDVKPLPSHPRIDVQDIAEESKNLTWDEFAEKIVHNTEQELPLSSSDVGDTESILAGSGIDDQIDFAGNDQVEDSVLDSVKEDTPSVGTFSDQTTEPITVFPLESEETHISEELNVVCIVDWSCEEAGNLDVQTSPFVNDKVDHSSSVSPKSSSGYRKSPKKEPPTPRLLTTPKTPKVYAKRKLFEAYSESDDWSSESDFDMSNSQPPPSFKRNSTTVTPSNKFQLASPFCSKKRKVLSKISDDEQDEPTAQREKGTKKDMRSQGKMKIKDEESVESNVEEPLEEGVDEGVVEGADDEDMEGADNGDVEGADEGDMEGTNERSMKESISSTGTETIELMLSIPVNRAKVNETHVSTPDTREKHHSSKPSAKGEVSTRRKSQRLKNSLPKKVDCAACGLYIAWEKAPVHMHKRLEVAVCEVCGLYHITYVEICVCV